MRVAERALIKVVEMMEIRRISPEEATYGEESISVGAFKEFVTNNLKVVLKRRALHGLLMMVDGNGNGQIERFELGNLLRKGKEIGEKIEMMRQTYQGGSGYNNMFEEDEIGPGT